MWLALSGAIALASPSAVDPCGADHLDQIGVIEFSFNVEKEGVLRSTRRWRWDVATGQVTLTKGEDVVTFARGAPADEAQTRADSAFVNDLFWFHVPLQIAWAGPDLTLEDRGTAPSPIGGAESRVVTLKYASEGGGYTPGDHYDLYLDPAGRITTWSYRAKGAEVADLTTTFEDYRSFGPLTVAVDHKSADGSFRLYFSDVVVTPR